MCTIHVQTSPSIIFFLLCCTNAMHHFFFFFLENMLKYFVVFLFYAIPYCCSCLNDSHQLNVYVPIVLIHNIAQHGAWAEPHRQITRPIGLLYELTSSCIQSRKVATACMSLNLWFCHARPISYRIYSHTYTHDTWHCTYMYVYEVE
jgi:hypothetical protein